MSEDMTNETIFHVLVGSFVKHVIHRGISYSELRYQSL